MQTLDNVLEAMSYEQYFFYLNLSEHAHMQFEKLDEKPKIYLFSNGVKLQLIMNFPEMNNLWKKNEMKIISEENYDLEVNGIQIHLPDYTKGKNKELDIYEESEYYTTTYTGSVDKKIIDLASKGFMNSINDMKSIREYNENPSNIYVLASMVQYFKERAFDLVTKGNYTKEIIQSQQQDFLSGNVSWLIVEELLNFQRERFERELKFVKEYIPNMQENVKMTTEFFKTMTNLAYTARLQLKHTTDFLSREGKYPGINTDKIVEYKDKIIEKAIYPI